MEYLLAQVAGRDIVELPDETTPIQDFYTGKTIFVTGGTGTIGRLVIAKLLQCCPGIEKIWLLTRAKNVQHISRRLEELLNHTAFDDLRYHHPELLRKIHLVRGEAALPNLGMAPQDSQKVMELTDIVLHLAGTTLFDTKFKSSVEINVRATRDLIGMARQMKNLKVFLHVSSLFVNSHKNVLEETYERPFISAKALIEFVESMDPNVGYDKPINLGRCPNNFIFTKGIAEELLKNENRNLPVVIVRLPLLISALRFPCRGFTDQADSLAGLIMTSYLGLNKSILAEREHLAEVFPTDMAANAIIAIVWDTAQRKALNDNVEVPKEEDFLIYNLSTTKQNKLQWKLFFHMCSRYTYRYPSIFTLSLPWYILHANKQMHFYLIMLLHYIPGYCIDFINIYLFYKTKYIGYYSKIDMLSRTLTYFMLHSWDVKVDNSRQLLRKMDEVDKELFDFDVTNIDWESYFDYFVHGIRKYLLKDSDRTMFLARKKNNKRLLILLLKMIAFIMFVVLVIYVF